MATARIYFIYSNSPPRFLSLNATLSPSPLSLNHHFPTTTSLLSATFQFPPILTRRSKLSAPAAMLHQNPLLSDLFASALSGAIALSLLRLWEQTAKRRLFDQSMEMLGNNTLMCDILGGTMTIGIIFLLLQIWKVTAKFGLDQKLNRKLVHISIGLVFMLCWPLFSSGRQGAVFAAITPGVNIIRMLLVGSGLWKDEATVKSMSRYGDHRELLKGPLYYAITITLASAVYWRTSPIGIAAICNLCAGDGIADVVGRRFGTTKLPYNRDKSFAGSVAFAFAGYLASIAFMCYFASFGYIQKGWEMVLGFLVVSVASAFVESLPISTELDDNLTVTLCSVILGTFVFSSQ